MIRLSQVTLRRGTKVLLEGADLALNPGERVGLIGANGSGKSSLFALLRGELHAVMSVLTSAIERSFGTGGSQALVLKVLNADLPIGEPPVLEPR